MKKLVLKDDCCADEIHVDVSHLADFRAARARAKHGSFIGDVISTNPYIAIAETTALAGKALYLGTMAGYQFEIVEYEGTPYLIAVRKPAA